MSIAQLQRDISKLDKEIVALEKKKAEKDKAAAEYDSKAAKVKISKNSSESMIRSKTKQIQRYQSEAQKARRASADLAKQIANKRKRRSEKATQLNKEEAKEQRKRDALVSKQRASNEQTIESLRQQIHQNWVDNASAESLGEGNVPEYDVFVSHAWEDKDDFVEEFVRALENRNLKVWYDKNRLKWGDSMRNKIDEGLRASKFGVAVLSPSYIAEGKYWTKAELDGLFQLESIGGKKLLPIWHNLTKNQVMEYSPMIASKFAMSTAVMTIEEIADELTSLFADIGS